MSSFIRSMYIFLVKLARGLKAGKSPLAVSVELVDETAGISYREETFYAKPALPAKLKDALSEVEALLRKDSNDAKISIERTFPMKAHLAFFISEAPSFKKFFEDLGEILDGVGVVQRLDKGKGLYEIIIAEDPEKEVAIFVARPCIEKAAFHVFLYYAFVALALYISMKMGGFAVLLFIVALAPVIYAWTALR